MKRVLCAVDLSNGSVNVLRYALAVAHWCGGCLTVLHVVPTSAREMQPREPFAAAVERLRETLAAAGIHADQVRCAVEPGDPARAIIARAVAIHADTIVLGTGAKHDGERQSIGPVTDAIVRRAPCDVLTVPPQSVAGAEYARASTIVCGIDFSPHSIYAIRATLGLANRMGARIILVHAIEWLAEVEPADGLDFDVSDFRTRLIYNARRRLDALIADESPLDCAIRTRVAIGRSHHEVLDVADAEHAELIVVGHRGHGAAAVPLLGSTIEQVVHAAPCPVLTIQSPHERIAHAEHR